MKFTLYFVLIIILSSCSNSIESLDEVFTESFYLDWRAETKNKLKSCCKNQSSEEVTKISRGLLLKRKNMYNHLKILDAQIELDSLFIYERYVEGSESQTYRIEIYNKGLGLTAKSDYKNDVVINELKEQQQKWFNKKTECCPFNSQNFLANQKLVTCETLILFEDKIKYETTLGF